MKNQKGFTVFEAILAVLFLVSAYGWIANIYKLATFGGGLSELGGLEILRAIGIFMAPLGAILGFF